MTPDEIKTILDAHALWVIGAGGSGANLSGVDLTGANLTGANLSHAKITATATLLDGVAVACYGPIGSRNGYTVLYNSTEGVYVSCGCFFGPVADFLTAVEWTHGDNAHGRAYRALVAFAETQFGGAR